MGLRELVDLAPLHQPKPSETAADAIGAHRDVLWNAGSGVDHGRAMSQI